MPLFTMRKRGTKGAVVETNPHSLLPSAPGGGYKPASSLPAGPAAPRPLTFGEKLIQSSRKLADKRADIKTVGEKRSAVEQNRAAARENASVAGTPHWQTGKTRSGAQSARNKVGSWNNLGKKK